MITRKVLAISPRPAGIRKRRAATLTGHGALQYSFQHLPLDNLKFTRQFDLLPAQSGIQKEKILVKLRNLELLIAQGLEIAYRAAHGAADQTLAEWLAAMPDAGARLLAIDDLLSGDDIYDDCITSESAQAFRVAAEVLTVVTTFCRDASSSLEVIINALDRDASP